MLDLADVQGLVLRGYTMPRARHLLLRVDSAAAGRALLGELVDGRLPLGIPDAQHEHLHRTVRGRATSAHGS